MERFHDMEISNKFTGEILAQVDVEFKEQLINENDNEIDELALHKKYTDIFNILGVYQKL